MITAFSVQSSNLQSLLKTFFVILLDMRMFLWHKDICRLALLSAYFNSNQTQPDFSLLDKSTCKFDLLHLIFFINVSDHNFFQLQAITN